MIAAPGAGIVTLEYCSRHRPIISGRRKMAMRYISLAIVLAVAVCVAAPAHAGYQYVASNGTDSSNCTRTAPCATVFAAIANAVPNDTIVCLNTVVDPTGLISIF